jgi:hypothetical protein
MRVKMVISIKGYDVLIDDNMAEGIMKNTVRNLNEYKSILNTPSEIFLAIDNQSVNRVVGESLIERYGDRRVMEAIADLQEKMGIELDKEVGKRIVHTVELIDKLYGKMIEVCPEKAD